MASDEPSGTRPAPVVLRIKLRYDDVDAMVSKFAPNVGKSGLFLPTKSLQAVGTEVKFELRLVDDKPVLVGLGRVKAARAPDPANPRASFGMAVELMRVTRESREVILRMLERRKQLGLPELGIPMPSDIDAARRADVDTGVRGSPVPAAPATMIDSGPMLSAPIAVETSVLTAPRRQTGPIAIAKAAVVIAPLGPEPARKRRAPMSEVIERASGPVALAAIPDLDEDIDVGAVLARARALAGEDLDSELDALRESAAAPIEVSIEAASAELARQLGGVAVDRSARWAPPPAVEVPAVVEPAPEPVVEAKEPEPAIVEAAAPDAPMPVDEEPLIARESAPILDIDPDPDDEDDDANEEVAPDQIADEIHQLSEEDFEEVEHTQIGAMPGPDDAPADEAEAAAEAAFVHAIRTEPGVAAELERSIAQQLDDAEREDEDLGIPPDLGPPLLAVDPDADPEADAEPEEEVNDFEILAEADAEDADLLSAHGEAEVSGGHTPLPPPAPAFADDDPYDGGFDEPQQSAFAAAYQDPPPSTQATSDAAFAALERPSYAAIDRPSQTDFVSRLDLSDQFEAAPPADPALEAALGGLDDDPLAQALGFGAGEDLDEERGVGRGADAGLEPDEDDDLGLDADSQFTHAGAMPPPTLDFESGPVMVPPPEPERRAFVQQRGRRLGAHHRFDDSDVIATGPIVDAPTAPPAGGDGYDLETALEALDVDLDELARPPDPPPVRGRHPRAERAQTDIPIDFDNDYDD